MGNDVGKMTSLWRIWDAFSVVCPYPEGKGGPLTFAFADRSNTSGLISLLFSP
jgi:hypothetical protein